MRRLGLSLALVLVSITSAQAQETEPESSVSLDAYVFSQRDGGGDPDRAEGFEYQGLRVAIVRKVNEKYRVRVNATVAFIDNEDAKELPSSVSNRLTTSASPSLLTLDHNLAIDITPEHSPWTFSPGYFYHHQIEYIGTGLDFGAARDLFEGNSRFEARYSFRWDFLELSYWDKTFRGHDDRISHNTLFSWTQLLSPAWKGNLSFQYTRQDGFLTDAFNYVTLYDPVGSPVFLTDERLPNRRDRFQVNPRIRTSPGVGTALGLDGSFYADSWGLEHFAIEPSVEVELLEGWRWRVWYRLSFQSETRYSRDEPVASARYQTRDSDLGSFFMQSPGTSLSLPVGEAEELRFSVYGFSRDDGIDGLGARMGVVFRW